MARLIMKARAKGFSLVELLIVVAIIGVLSTIGVPTFRRMVTKAKKSEARTALGGLFTVESAFFTEYNLYGDRLNRIGFELEGARRYYSVGFPLADTCTSATTYSPPNVTGAPGALLAANFPTYYDAAVVPDVAANGLQGDTVYHRTTTGAVTGHKCFIGPTTVNSIAYTTGIVDPYTKYLASATGHIAPGSLPTSAIAPSTTAGTIFQDVWVINNKRDLVNIVDGTN